MSAPFGYQPFAYPGPYLWPYFQQQVVTTPLIPSPIHLPPPSPNAGSGSRRVHFDDDDDVYHTGRPRPPSWHAGMAGMAPAPNQAPFPSPPFYYTSLPPVVPVQASGPPPGHHRRYSDGVLPQPTWIQVPTWMAMPYPRAPPPQAQPQLNPLLDAESGRQPPILFDLSFYTFEPRRASPSNPSGVSLSADELSQTATYPGVTRMVITCDEIPEWQVVLEPYRERPSHSGYLGVPADSSAAANAPITVNDVLYAVHRMLQRQIVHADWVKLSNDKATAVARAYTRRCRTFPTTQAFEESQGVKRVDYLESKYMFKGLARHRGEQGFEHVRLIVGRR